MEMNESFSSKIKSKKTSDLKTDTFPSPSVIIEKIGDRVGVSFADKIKGIKSITEVSLIPERFDPIQGTFVRKNYSECVYIQCNDKRYSETFPFSNVYHFGSRKNYNYYLIADTLRKEDEQIFVQWCSMYRPNLPETEISSSDDREYTIRTKLSFIEENFPEIYSKILNILMKKYKSENVSESFTRRTSKIDFDSVRNTGDRIFNINRNIKDFILRNDNNGDTSDGFCAIYNMVSDFHYNGKSYNRISVALKDFDNGIDRKKDNIMLHNWNDPDLEINLDSMPLKDCFKVFDFLNKDNGLYESFSHSIKRKKNDDLESTATNIALDRIKKPNRHIEYELMDTENQSRWDVSGMDRYIQDFEIIYKDGPNDFIESYSEYWHEPYQSPYLSDDEDEDGEYYEDDSLPTIEFQMDTVRGNHFKLILDNDTCKFFRSTNTHNRLPETTFFDFELMDAVESGDFLSFLERLKLIFKTKIESGLEKSVIESFTNKTTRKKSKDIVKDAEQQLLDPADAIIDFVKLNGKPFSKSDSRIDYFTNHPIEIPMGNIQTKIFKEHKIVTMLSVFVYNGKYGLKDELQVFTPKGTATLMTDRGVIHGDGLYYSNLKYYEESEEFHKSDIQPYFKRLLLKLIEDQETIKER